MLAKTTSSASDHIPLSISSWTPPRIVLGSPRSNYITVMTGNTFAGT